MEQLNAKLQPTLQGLRQMDQCGVGRHTPGGRVWWSAPAWFVPMGSWFQCTGPRQKKLLWQFLLRCIQYQNRNQCPTLRLLKPMKCQAKEAHKDWPKSFFLVLTWQDRLLIWTSAKTTPYRQNAFIVLGSVNAQKHSSENSTNVNHFHVSEGTDMYC